jgi:RNA recognition motif-containing protein
MGKKLYVGNIPYQAEENELKDFFSAIGEVESVKIIIDLQTGHSKGFGFVEMASEEDAKKAISDLNGTTFMGKTVVINEARPQKPRERGSFGGGRGGYDKGGRGGFGRDRGPGHQRGRR